MPKALDWRLNDTGLYHGHINLLPVPSSLLVWAHYMCASCTEYVPDQDSKSILLVDWAKVFAQLCLLYYSLFCSHNLRYTRKFHFFGDPTPIQIGNNKTYYNMCKPVLQHYSKMITFLLNTLKAKLINGWRNEYFNVHYKGQRGKTTAQNMLPASVFPEFAFGHINNKKAWRACRESYCLGKWSDELLAFFNMR